MQQQDTPRLRPRLPRRAAVLRAALLAPLLAGSFPDAAGAQVAQRVKDTVHNLSASGPGAIRAAGETEICVFCHTPHGAGDVRPLWNRNLPAGPYQIYRSTSLRANVGQPTGSSKLCLSCHDGTIALGDVLSRETPIAMVGADRMPPGPGLLGTDLRDDHPISFPYAASVSPENPDLVPETAIAPPVKLDETGEVQCTSCHEPHDNTHGDFLVRSNDSGALCTSCHRFPYWPSADHATSPAPVSSSAAATLGLEPSSTAEQACGSCHKTHGAGGESWLVRLENITATCLPCHDGTVAPGNVASEISKPSDHGIEALGPGGTGGPYLEGDRLSCADCHDSHAAGSATGTSGTVPESLAQVDGVTLSGSPIPAITDEYQLCFRCHGDSPAIVDMPITRTIIQPNKRLQFQPTNPSFHPVGNPGANAGVPSLVPPLTASSTIGCGDCHTSDQSRKLGGSGPAGPHGSIHEPLLGLRYDTTDFSLESPASYALCYRCHERDSILSDESFKSHRKHVVDVRAPCSVCHDPHGIFSGQGTSSANSHLMNFDRSVVFPSSSGRLEFRDLGTFRGECFLSCHGVDHDPLAY